MTDLTGIDYGALALALACWVGFDMLANRPRDGKWASLSHLMDRYRKRIRGIVAIRRSGRRNPAKSGRGAVLRNVGGNRREIVGRTCLPADRGGLAHHSRRSRRSFDGRPKLPGGDPAHDHLRAAGERGVVRNFRARAGKNASGTSCSMNSALISKRPSLRCALQSMRPHEPIAKQDRQGVVAEAPFRLRDVGIRWCSRSRRRRRNGPRWITVLSNGDSRRTRPGGAGTGRSKAPGRAYTGSPFSIRRSTSSPAPTRAGRRSATAFRRRASRQR